MKSEKDVEMSSLRKIGFRILFTLILPVYLVLEKTLYRKQDCDYLGCAGEGKLQNARPCPRCSGSGDVLERKNFLSRRLV